mmetsp:Transcript_141297/g.451607  ORF Transcript_141297/g.451607 Transcript_141297/m.451607 type:complete len:156 (+) Transcript_141297:3-470(+)
MMPGFHKAFRKLALLPFSLAAFSSFAMICRHSGGVPGIVARAAGPFTEASTRYKLMQSRADTEVMLGFALLLGTIAGSLPFFCPLVYWNILSLRYVSSPWTQASFRKADGWFSPVLKRIPGVSTLCTKLKGFLHNWAMPSERGAGRGITSRCSIL